MPLPQSRISLRHRKLTKAYHTVFEYEGEDVLLDICREGMVFSTTQVSSDQYLSAFNEGKRALALYILGRIRRSGPDMLKLLETKDE